MKRLVHFHREAKQAVRFVRMAGRAIIRGIRAPKASVEPRGLEFKPYVRVTPNHPCELCQCTDLEQSVGHLPDCQWAAVMCRTCDGLGWCPSCCGDGIANASEAP